MTASSPLVVSVAELARRPGTRRDEHRSVVLEGLGTSAATVPEGATIDLDLTLEAISSAIVVTGSVTAPWTGSCRRCLGDARGEAIAEVREIFEPRPTEGETYPLDGEQLDLEPMVRDAVLLALPLAPLCADGCLGPAPDTVAVRTADEPPDGDDAETGGEGSAPAGDPRWAALDELHFD